MSLLRQAAKALLPSSLRYRLRLLHHKVEPVFYRGDDVECPCCGAQFSRFLPHGRPVRLDARCGRCDALERHRALALFLVRHTPLYAKRQRLLHFAPEKAFQAMIAARSGLHVTTDYQAGGVDVQMDITRLALRDASFDAIVCVHVLEHIPDDRRALRELWRVLTAGGWAILQVPLDIHRAATYEDFSITSPEERRTHFLQEDHVRIYGRDFKDRLEEAGFRVEIIPFGRSLPEAERRRYGIRSDEELYYCTKGL